MNDDAKHIRNVFSKRELLLAAKGANSTTVPLDTGGIVAVILSSSICSPLDQPQGLRRGYFFISLLLT